MDDYKNWTYVPLNLDDSNRDWVEKDRLSISYLNWLLVNAGHQGKDWEYRRGNIFALGLYFRDAATATVFKLSNMV